MSTVKSLSPAQKAKLRKELYVEEHVRGDEAEFIAMLLGGPVYSEEEIKKIEKNRESIANQRTDRRLLITAY